jgi:hypothetical protein
MKEPPVEQNGLDWTPPFYSQEVGFLTNEKPDKGAGLVKISVAC